MAQKPSLPKGTRDFSPEEVAKRNYIIGIIKSNFEKFGFQPIETPSFENSETLMGKYGEEGDRLIFKILNSGDFLSKVKDEHFKEKNSQKITSKISEKALRYDLTVPFARYVVQHQNELDFPFKRYQIQPVWRADRPQKGRFREFFQCDADVVGSNSLWQETDFVLLYDSVFSDLQIKKTHIKLNHRKILSGFAEVIGETEKLIDFTVALDKLDKIGEAGVKKEMLEKGIRQEAINEIQPIFDISGDFEEKISGLKEILKNSEIGKQGISELEFIYNAIKSVPLKTAILELDVTLARGLNYYTGTIMEVSAPDEVQMGSIGGGGRYDDLAGIFGLKNLSGVGISFGLDRIYLVLEELDLFPKNLGESIKVLFLNYGEREALYCLKAVNRLRNLGVSAELFPDDAKMKKQMNYANKRAVPYVVLAGSKEIGNNLFTLKNMKTGEQNQVDFDELTQQLV
ncbi:MAG TPA: histidine--tRNA ligase [Flavobacteriaceae bacterium]|nr:histidine--tRNA ligase [Flavobacteriaceae bacterium]